MSDTTGHARTSPAAPPSQPLQSLPVYASSSHGEAVTASHRTRQRHGISVVPSAEAIVVVVAALED